MYNMRNALRQYLKENGIKQCFLAQESGISVDNLSRILRGQRCLYADDLMCLCEVLHIQPQDLLDPCSPHA